MTKNDQQLTPFSAQPEVRDQITALCTQLSHLCLENQIPYVAGFVMSNDDDGATIASSAYLDSDAGRSPTNLVAAYLAIHTPDIPEEIVLFLRDLNRLPELVNPIAEQATHQTKEKP